MFDSRSYTFADGTLHHGMGKRVIYSPLAVIASVIAVLAAIR